MKIVAAVHPLIDGKPSKFGPDALSELLSGPSSGLPAESWHIGFSRAGNLLYRSDNLPDFFQKLATTDAMDAFLEELDHWIHFKDLKNYGDFRSKIFTDGRIETVVRVNRRSADTPPMIGIASRKYEDGYHMVLVPEKNGTNADVVLRPGFFSGEPMVMATIGEWLEKVDEETLSCVALETFRHETGDAGLPNVLVRPVNGSPVNLSMDNGAPGTPQMVGDMAALTRWWGTVVENSDRPKNFWIHTVLRCGRIQPVVIVSGDTDVIRTIGITAFRKILIRMSEKILEYARVFTWSKKYRYAKFWNGVAGYDIKQAEAVIEMMSLDGKPMSVIPIYATSRDLKSVSRKIRIDEPYFWDEKRHQIWVILRDTTLENAEVTVRPSFVSRMENLIGVPMSVETFVLKYCHD